MSFRDTSRETMLLARLATLQQGIAEMRQEQMYVLTELVRLDSVKEQQELSVRAAKARTLRNLSPEDLREIFRLLLLKAPAHYGEALSLLTPEQLEQLDPINP